MRRACEALEGISQREKRRCSVLVRGVGGKPVSPREGINGELLVGPAQGAFGAQGFREGHRKRTLERTTVLEVRAGEPSEGLRDSASGDEPGRRKRP